MLPWYVGRSTAGFDEGTSEGNGEQIYFSAVSERTGRIGYRGGPPGGGMMTGSWGLACVSCHGADGRGGAHVMHMLSIDAPDIHWWTLAAEMGEGHEGQSLPEGEHGEGMTAGGIRRRAMAKPRGVMMTVLGAALLGLHRRARQALEGEVRPG